MRRLILKHAKAPGDVAVFTAVVRDLKLAYGDDLQIDVRTSWPAMFENNPHLTQLNSKQASLYEISYADGIARAGRGEKIHFLTEFHREVRRITGLHAPVRFPKPDLHLTEYERNNPPVSGRYWLVFAGGKSDMTTKHWDHRRHQEVVNQLLDRGIRCAQSGAIRGGQVTHMHPPLENVLNLVGWGGLRELLWQIYHCEGVICPITCASHVAAAFDKPCVVIAGGREEPHWEWYTNRFRAFGDQCEPVKVAHRFLHTLGQIDCCLTKGCWRRKVVPIGSDTSLCHHPLTDRFPALPLCLDMITTDMVVDAVMSYYREEILPPI